jgi:adenosylhomocysteine nucleosidase
VTGFVVPLENEARTLMRVLKQREIQTHRGREIMTGLLDKERCAVLISGTGKIRSASGTQLLLDHFDCTTLYHFGSAGALAPELRIGDVVIANDIVEHDYIQRFGVTEDHPIAVSHEPLVAKLLKFGSSNNVPVHRGRIVSGNEDVVTTLRRDELRERFGGLSVDWESAGCALVCNINRVPVVVVRAISDYAYEKTHDEYSQNGIAVCAKVCDFLIQFLSSHSR